MRVENAFSARFEASDAASRPAATPPINAFQERVCASRNESQNVSRVASSVGVTHDTDWIPRCRRRWTSAHAKKRMSSMVYQHRSLTSSSVVGEGGVACARQTFVEMVKSARPPRGRAKRNGSGPGLPPT